MSKGYQLISENESCQLSKFLVKDAEAKIPAYESLATDSGLAQRILEILRQGVPIARQWLAKES